MMHRTSDQGGPAPRPWVAAALVHHPVLDAQGAEIAATCHPLDLLDAGRLSLAYPLARFYIVQPLAAQRDLARRLIAHADADAPDRDVALRGHLSKLVLVESLAEALADAREQTGRPVSTFATTARPDPSAIGWPEGRAQIAAGTPVLVLFGKAAGLSGAVLAAAEARLAPISGGTGFDHLPVRAAMAIALDRLLGL